MTLAYVKWLRVEPDRPAMVPIYEWPFANSIHFGTRMAWAVLRDEKPTDGPFETLCEAWRWSR